MMNKNLYEAYDKWRDRRGPGVKWMPPTIDAFSAGWYALQELIGQNMEHLGRELAEQAEKIRDLLVE